MDSTHAARTATATRHGAGRTHTGRRFRPARHRLPGRAAGALFAVALAMVAGCQGAGGGTEASGPSRGLYVVGDSWAEMLDDQLRDELDDRGFDQVQLRPFGVGGSTMRDWTSTDQDPMRAVVTALEADAGVEPILLLILGGNDLLDDRASPGRVSSDLRRIVSILTTAREDAGVVLASYDVVNPAVAPAECREQFDAALGVTRTAEITRLFREQWAALEGAAAELGSVVAVDAFGSLQGNPGDPDLDAPSPVEYLLDCLHLNDAGYDVYLDELFARALTPALCRSEEAAICRGN